MTLAAPPRTIRVAIYTRQSVADDKEFGSLEAQREAIESYVRSQPDWQALDARYDDSGFSGGTTKRPAFQRLLQDVEQGDIDAVAVYKLDRLSRSINDFVRITDTFERHGVRFISTTQAFDTSTSMGRMTVNLLATFATFEREMISERTRDKIAATRRKGLWTGGPVPLGYDLVEKKLVVNTDEAARVRDIFDLYLEHNSLLAVTEELNCRRWTTKSWVMKNGETKPGLPFTIQRIRALLTRATYIGKVTIHGETHLGEHDAIVEEKTWNAVQRQLKKNGKTSRRRGGRVKSGALLCGLVRCGVCGQAMTSHSSRRGNRRYLAYVCTTYQKQGAAACPGSRVRASDLESHVIDHVRAIGRNPEIVRETITAAREELAKRRPELEAQVRELQKQEQRLTTQRQNLLEAIAKGNKSSGIFEKLGTVEAEVDTVMRNVAQARQELQALDGQIIDEDDLRRALGQFDPVWDHLVTDEKTRVLQLLIEQVAYNGQTGNVEITFRRGGVRALAEEEKETA